MGRRMRWVLAAVAAVAGLLVGPPAASGEPSLRIPEPVLARALACHGALTAGPTPVLLVPGTTLTPDVNFSWNYEPAFTAAHRAWCAVTIPDHGMSDIQLAAEYLVYAIRTMHAEAGRKISVVGFSQGGMSPRWALKWWPDTRAMVDDLVSLDASNHGTADADVVCLLTCAPSIWQQRPDSAFLHALNTGGETYPGISYTQVYSDFDEVVVSNVGSAASSALHTGGGDIANVEVQKLCPLHLADHLVMGTFDAVGYAVVVDALTHSGPASPARISRTTCATLAMPGVTGAQALAGMTRVGLEAGEQLLLHPQVAHEPALAPYAR